MEREKLGSRLGFILLSAGCAIGCGNVWKFPWMCGEYGGGVFLLIYLICLVLLGLRGQKIQGNEKGRPRCGRPLKAEG